MSFGAFMKGMQGGLETMQGLRRERQLDDLYDAAITEAEDALSKREHDLGRINKTLKRKRTNTTFIGMLSDKMDPVLARFMERIGGEADAVETSPAGVAPEPVPAGALPEELDEVPGYWRGGKVKRPKNQVDTTPSKTSQAQRGQILREQGPARPETIQPQADKFDPEKMAIDENGPKAADPARRERYNPDSPEEIKRRTPPKQASRTSPPASRAPEPTQTIDRRPPARTAIPESPAVGKSAAARRLLGSTARLSGVGTGALALSGALLSGHEAYYGGIAEKQMAADKRLSELARKHPNLTPEEMDELTRLRAAFEARQGTSPDDKLDPSMLWPTAKAAGKGAVEAVLGPIFGRDEEEAAPAPAPATEALPTQPTERGLPPGGHNRVPTRPSTALPEDAVEEDPLAGFDVSKIPADQIPNYSNQDWVSFRQNAIEDYVMGGMSYAEAWEKVDQQVVNTQMRGFAHFGNQARQLLKAGDLNGAASAVRAAFQYLPSTTDLKVGVYNGHLVAFGIDEDTGQQVGRPVPIDDTLLNDVLMNFSDRNNWAQHAQDNKKLDLMDEQTDIERQRANALDRRNEIDAFVAETGALGAGSGGMKLADADRYTQFWEDQTAQAAVEGKFSENMDLQRAMTVVMAAMYRQERGQSSPENVATTVIRMSKSAAGRQRIMELAAKLSGG